MAGPWEQYQGQDKGPWSEYSAFPQFPKPEEKPDTGFTGALKSSYETLKGEAALVAGKTGIMSLEEAEKYYAGQQEKARKAFKPTEEGWTEAPLTKFKELLGGSVPYMAAPIGAAVGVATLPVSGTAATVLGLGAAGAASAAQFTGSNLARQMDTGKSLAQTDLVEAGTAAIPQAALDTLSFKLMPGVGRIFGQAGVKISDDVAQQVAKKGIAATAGEYALSGVKIAGIEGGTEAAQQFFERLQAGLNIADEEARKEYYENFIGGAVLGSTIGVGGRAYEKAFPRKAAQADEPNVTLQEKPLTTPTTLALPSPEEIILNEREYDPLKNPIGNFSSDELTPDQIKYIDADRKANGKPKLKSYSLEDLVDAVNHSDETAAAKQGIIDNLLTFKTGYTGEVDLTPDDVYNVARQKNVETQTQGFNDFLRRATGSEDVMNMSQPQLFSAFEALSKLEPSEELMILPEGTNAVRFSEQQYEKALRGLESVYDEFGTSSLGRTSVIQEIKDFAGLERDADAEALYRQALRRNDLEENLREVKTTEGTKTVPEVSFAGKIEPLPSGFDIRYQTFKQGVEPAEYEIKNGSVVIDRAKTAEDAQKVLDKQTKINQELVKRPEAEIAKLEKAIANRNTALDIQRAKGFGDTLGFRKLAAELDARNKVDQKSIEVHRTDIQNFNNPLKIVPVGEKPITSKKYVFYEGDKPVASFGDKYQAEQFGIMKLDEGILGQIIETGPKTKGVLPKRYAAFAAKEMQRRKGELPKGIEVRKSIYTEKVDENLEKLRQQLLPTLKRFGLEKVGLRIVNSIADGKADGSYVQALIKIAVDAKNPMGTLRHESIHALKELGAFTPEEWKVLSNKAKSEWIGKYIKPNMLNAYREQYLAENKSLKGFDEYIQEEAIAEAFADFANTKPPAGLIGNLFFRLNKFFEALGNAFKRLGFKTANDIFQKVERGEAKPTKVAVSEKEKLQFKPEDFSQIESGLDGYLTEQEENLRQNYIYNNRGRNELGKALENNDAYQDALQQNLDAIGTPNTITMYRGRDITKRWTDSQGKYLNVSSSKKLAENFRKASMTKPENWTVDTFLVPKDAIIGLGHPEEREFIINMNKGVEIVGITAEPTTIENIVQPKLKVPEEIRKIGENLVGAPPNARTVKDRTALVRKMTNLLEHPYSMYDDSKGWYERSGDTIRQIARGDEKLMEKIVRLMSLYSQANSLGGNVTALVKSLSQLAKGESTAYAGRFPSTTAEVIPQILAAKNFDTDLKGVNDKLMNFYHNLHDGTFKDDTFEDSTTIDRWMMRLFGYPHNEDREAGGASAVSATQYKYAKDLIRRIAEANEKKTGEKLAPRQIQAVLWTYVKNSSDAAKAKEEGRPFKPTTVDFSDYINRATANITWESRPSTSIDLIPGIHKASRKEQDDFNRAVRKIFENDDGSSKIFELLNEGVLYSSQNSIGAYENQIAPNVITRLVLEKDDKGHVTEIADKAAAIIGYVTKQDAVPWYRADPTASGKMASKGYKVSTTETVTPEFEEKLFKHLDKEMPGVGFTRVDNSFDFINFRGDDGKPFFMSDKEYITKLQKALETFSPDVDFTIDPFKTESAYIFNNWKENPDGQSYLERFGSRQLSDIRPTLDNWSKAYTDLAEQYGREYGWDKGEGLQKGERARIRPPETEEFKDWIGDSVAVDENLNPILFYHGTDQDITTFKPSKEGALGKGIYLTPDPEYASNYTRESQFGEKRGTGANVIPLYARVEFPLIINYKRGFDPAIQALEKLGLSNDKAADIVEKAYEDKGNLTGEIMSRAKKVGHDAIFYMDEDGKTIREAVVFDPRQVKSAFAQKPTKESKDIRYSLRDTVDPTIWGSVDRTTTKREEKGFIQRLLSSIFPDSAADFRFKYINALEGIERQTKEKGRLFGDKELLAENSALAAALQSLRAAGVAASSFRDGIPVYDKGYTYVTDNDGKNKGLIPIFEPLAKYGDPEIFRLFQFYAATKRGKRLMADGREKLFTADDIAKGEALEKQFPEFKTVFNEYQIYNKGLVDYMKATGVISDAEAKIWTQNWDYIPFYRQLEGDTTAGPKVFSSLSGVSKPKKLKGGQEELADFMETIVRNSRAAIEAGMKNEAARRAIRDAKALGTAEELKESDTGADIVNVKENGKTKYYRVADPLLVKSMQSLNMPQLELISFLGKPAEILRNFVTKDPGFILANLGRDSLQAWITSGTKMRPVVDTFQEFGNTLFKQSPVANALARAGMTGYDFAGDVKSTSDQVMKELRKRGGARTVGEKALLPISALWDALEQGSHASDMATRVAIYKQTLERTGSEAEAMYQAMEVLNFSRRGASPTVRMLAAMIPFLNARIQGLDVLYRSGWGEMATENKDAMKKAFAVRALTMMGMSMLYWFLVSDEDEYKKLTKEERDNYWIVPGLEVGDKPFRFPIPFELGVIFKVIPERVLETAFGSDTGKDLKESMVRQLTGTLAVSPPQAFLPILENLTNYSLFTGEPLVGRGLQDLEPKYQFTSGTSQMFKDLGALTNISPIKIENLVRGYTGTLGTYAVQALDAIYRGEGDPVKATMRTEQMPVIKRFFATDSGTVSAYYDLKEEVDTAVRTVNMLERTGKGEELREYLQGKGKVYLMKDYVNALEKNMKQIREARRVILDSKDKTADEKRQYLDSLHDMEVRLTENIRSIRKQFQ